MARTLNSDFSWNVSLVCNFTTRRVRFLILKNFPTSMSSPGKMYYLLMCIRQDEAKSNPERETTRC